MDGKISKISTQKNSVSIEGIKKEKTKGDKFDVYIHTSNLVVTSLNTGDKWRMARLEGKDPRKQPKDVPKEKPAGEEIVKKVSKETIEAKKTEKKEDEK